MSCRSTPTDSTRPARPPRTWPPRPNRSCRHHESSRNRGYGAMTGQHPAVPHPNANYPGLPHEELKKLVTVNVDPGSAYKAGDEWKQLAGQLREAAITLDAAINGSQ